MSVVFIRRDYLPADLLEAATALYESTKDWQRLEQRVAYGPGHQQFDVPELPRDGEDYIATFDRSDSLGVHPVFAEIARRIGGGVYRCYRMGPGDGFRIHRDDYFGGEWAHTLYLNREWVWDWGGLLHVLEDGECRCILPACNTLTAVRYAPHFVSTVAPWARVPRYVLAVFGATTPAA